ncbi:MAG TPA: alpha/beta hydrolase-fold protein [Acidimicrobiales bacterium]|jgi:enterochelin esterase-like enzyme|nr:alpha/beta hydrolase-fold protein [Acidimicrobiales bacterium]
MVYCLNGYHADHHFAFDQIQLPDVIAMLKAPLGVAAVDGGADSYRHRRANGSDTLTMLLDEFLPFVEQRTKTTRRALGGWSMGGYGAPLVAETAPDRIFGVAAASPHCGPRPAPRRRGRSIAHRTTTPTTCSPTKAPRHPHRASRL